ncbi:Mrp/NBP35 family ATP-binding protein [bacterium]|nr:Mrp/NBP35 family ATP-binding protein [bacterium]
MIKSVEKVKNIIFVASGKGGVGKTTVATNLAVALSREGFKTGLFDADLYGPSVPLALGVTDQHPTAEKKGAKETMRPVEKYGIKIMSLGFLVKKENAAIWRGPMAANALTHMLENTEWGELDYLVIDTPPGTGDICITLSQKLPQAKALIVITPQQMAIADGIKAGNMYKAKGINIELLGVVENMAWFTPEKHPDEKYFLFGQGGGNQLAKELGCPVLAQIPLVSDVCELGDTGRTIFASSSKIVVDAFEELADKIEEASKAATQKRYFYLPNQLEKSKQ